MRECLTVNANHGDAWDCSSISPKSQSEESSGIVSSFGDVVSATTVYSSPWNGLESSLTTTKGRLLLP
nr:hypothetical protein [Halorussus salinus]